MNSSGVVRGTFRNLVEKRLVPFISALGGTGAKGVCPSVNGSKSQLIEGDE